MAEEGPMTGGRRMGDGEGKAQRRLTRKEPVDA
jgi:hypothetical protein